MDFNIKDFMEEAINRMGNVVRVEIDYDQYDDFRAKLIITAYNENNPVKFNDFLCESVMGVYFGSGCTNEKYIESKEKAKEIRGYLKKNHPNIEVYRSTKCKFVWFE